MESVVLNLCSKIILDDFHFQMTLWFHGPLWFFGPKFPNYECPGTPWVTNSIIQILRF